jgi:hypothetical protein
MMIYALGRGLEPYDKRAIKKIVASLPAQGNRFSAVVLGIVGSVPFQMRSTAAPPAEDTKTAQNLKKEQKKI